MPAERKLLRPLTYAALQEIWLAGVCVEKTRRCRYSLEDLRHEACSQSMEEECDGAESAAEEATNAAA